MGIEFSQIHNLVRTYERILDVPSSKQVREDRVGTAAEDRISISPQAREQEDCDWTDHSPDGVSQQDRECPT
jgi:hypothetical protein